MCARAYVSLIVNIKFELISFVARDYICLSSLTFPFKTRTHLKLIPLLADCKQARAAENLSLIGYDKAVSWKLQRAPAYSAPPLRLAASFARSSLCFHTRFFFENLLS